VNPAAGNGLFYGEWTTFLAHIKALVIVCGYVFVMSWVCYRLTALLTPLRLRREQESIGLDMTQHAESQVKEGEMVMA
jgi:Amt family ammonium transporter